MILLSTLDYSICLIRIKKPQNANRLRLFDLSLTHSHHNSQATSNITPTLAPLSRCRQLRDSLAFIVERDAHALNMLDHIGVVDGIENG